MAKFIKLENGSYVKAAASHRIHLEKHTDPKFWKLNAQLSKPEGGAEWAYLAGEFGSLKEAEEAVRKLGK
ncbi:hypothetical protein E5F05_05510 (plasmid) [Deinococcus metallilatus]|uniref:Uncharacterized protein n=1 Tax=Deinococcus metallilatus TaxID=1211322 RepID=A0AAJ5F5A1_9DEIO|nr:hypothetical protein [Deinococcus metallilatus]MBB5293587.1 hypothetical protein [Deinococcus metallilatus]QBY07427.1 hypothetical protein E5F05_05510 [Deinococcus metallilatus]RXJ14900.1 hypothetical protein ERJ73_04230 [Deinococcus metallilatus]TLK31021.1 hypothetical protein FCS05_04545 [Deinococcus metallilatus]GMA17940.1 hypothetical protein GCM10025871_42710 [Deinococcus metallilatus]